MERAGLINEYVCTVCGKSTRTVNRDEGVTPFMISCKVQPGMGCGAEAHSSFYQCNQETTAPRWEWIRPTAKEFEAYITATKQEQYRKQVQDHVDNGGMLLVYLDPAGRERYGFRSRRA